MGNKLYPALAKAVTDSLTYTLSMSLDVAAESKRKILYYLLIEDIELKTPLPNLDVAAESKRKILYYLLIEDRQGVSGAQAFLGLTYNPFLTRERYSHSFTKQIMDMDNQVLMGQEMWDFIGGPGTFDELLAIIEDVHHELPEVG